MQRFKSSLPSVVVTGMGLLCPTGNTLKESWENVCEGRSGIRTISHFDPLMVTSKIAGEIKNFHPEQYISAKEARRYDRFICIALAAAQQALDDAGLMDSDTHQVDLTRVGVNVSSGIGGLPEIEATALKFYQKGQQKISPFFIPATIGNMAAGLISIKHALKGPSYGCVSACASSNHAIGEAYRTILFGDADIMVTGGSEATISGLTVGGFGAMKALSVRNDDPEKASRPWSKGRDGFVIGEGSGLLVLESLEHAKKRGAKIYAELVGYGASSDGHHITAPCEDGEGAVRCMQATLNDAQCNVQDVDYINAHGTSTPLGDLAETVAVKRAFGVHAKQLVMSSTKSMTGHLLGAAGGIEAVFSIMALYHGTIPPTINLNEADEGCDLDYCAHTAREKACEYVLSNSFGFGGTNASLLFKRFHG